jgi:hypothetical protein
MNPPPAAPAPTYRDLLDLASGDAATTRPAVALLRSLATATPAEDLVGDLDDEAAVEARS